MSGKAVHANETKHAPGDDLVNPMANCPTHEGSPELPPEQERVIGQALSALSEAGVPFIVAGAFASHAYSGMWRETKDMDLFLPPHAVPAAMRALEAAGFETEVRHRWWLAKAWRDDHLVDLVFGIGNREIQVDDGWIERGLPVEICGAPARLISLEDLIVSKVFIAFRDRFDGADVVHLIRCMAGRVDWDQVLEVLGERHRGLLLWHLFLFDYVYPGHADQLPHDLIRRLFEERARQWQSGAEADEPFRGTLLDHRAFAVDVKDWGYPDPRRAPESVEEVTPE